MQYAIDRETLCRDILNGTCIPAKGMVSEKSPQFGNPEETYSYDPAKAKALLAEAGVELPLKFNLLTSTAGSGQMSPIIMNEFIQRNLKEMGVDMEIVAVEWNALLDRTVTRSPEEGEDKPDNYTFEGINEDFNATNISHGTPWTSAWPFYWRSTRDPGSFLNLAGYANDEVDALYAALDTAFDPAKQHEILGRIHEIVVVSSAQLWIVHDLNPRAMNPRVQGYVQDQAWVQTLQDLWIVE